MSNKPEGNLPEEVYKYVANFLNKVEDLVKEYGIQPCIHPHFGTVILDIQVWNLQVIGI